MERRQKMKNSQFVYVVNEYVGGCPMDSQCHGVFTTLDKARQYYINYINQIKDDCEELQDNISTNSEFGSLSLSDSCFWDIDDLWGGLEITAVKLNR